MYYFYLYTNININIKYVRMCRGSQKPIGPTLTMEEGRERDFKPKRKV